MKPIPVGGLAGHRQAAGVQPDFVGVDLAWRHRQGRDRLELGVRLRALRSKRPRMTRGRMTTRTTFLVDLDPSYGAAFANWRINPNTSEIRGASVYFSRSGRRSDLIFDDDPTTALPAKMDQAQTADLGGMPRKTPSRCATSGLRFARTPAGWMIPRNRFRTAPRRPADQEAERSSSTSPTSSCARGRPRPAPQPKGSLQF